MINILISKDILQTKQFLNIIMLKNHISDDEVVNLDFNVNNDLDMHFNQMNLFSTTKLFIVHNANFLTTVEDFKKQTKLMKKMNELHDSEIMIYLVASKKPLSNAEFVNLTKTWKIDTIKEIDTREKNKIIDDLLKNNEIFLHKDVYSFLLQSLDNSYGNIYNEIQKLSILLKTKTSNEDAIEIISNFNAENIFHLFEALLTKNHSSVWKIYNDLMYRHEDEISIINALASQAHNLFYILKLLKQHYPVTTIAKMTNVSIYFINFYKTKFINYNIDIVNNFMLSLYKLEVDIKLSKINKNYGFKQFLLEISH